MKRIMVESVINSVFKWPGRYMDEKRSSGLEGVFWQTPQNMSKLLAAVVLVEVEAIDSGSFAVSGF